jgi:excisionase family DNA binding protein
MEPTRKEPTRKEWFNITEVATILEVDYKTIYHLVRDKGIGSIKIGREYQIPLVELEAYLLRASQTLTEGRTLALLWKPGAELPVRVIREPAADEAPARKQSERSAR